MEQQLVPNQERSMSVQSLSPVQLCDPMECSTPVLPVHHQILEFTQTHVHQVGDAIQPHNKLWKILKEMGIPDHLTCLLRNLYACQEATVRTGHGTTDWF